MFFTRKLKKEIVFGILLNLLLVSLFLSIFLTESNPTEAFYLLPFRAWELGFGGLLAFLQVKYIKDYKISGLVNEFLSLIGLFLILGSIFYFNENTPFPSFWALFPVIGTTLLILSAKDQKTLVSKMLSLKPVVFVGMISYSLYLWHWPMLVFNAAIVI